MVTKEHGVNPPFVHVRELVPLINRGSFHGEAYVLACSGADNVAWCDQVLVAAEHAGLIARGKLAPTPQQRFFNVNHDTQPSHHHWITKTTVWMDEDKLAEALR